VLRLWRRSPDPLPRSGGPQAALPRVPRLAARKDTTRLHLHWCDQSQHTCFFGAPDSAAAGVVGCFTSRDATLQLFRYGQLPGGRSCVRGAPSCFHDPVLRTTLFFVLSVSRSVGTVASPPMERPAWKRSNWPATLFVPLSLIQHRRDPSSFVHPSPSQILASGSALNLLSWLVRY